MMRNRKPGAGNVFRDLGFSVEQSRILGLKAQLAVMILKAVDNRGLTQKQLSRMWGVPQPRVSEILSGKLNLVSIERLVAFLAVLGTEVAFRKVAGSGARRQAG
jgi:predicted XRE-type DNA-binding protein